MFWPLHSTPIVGFRATQWKHQEVLPMKQLQVGRPLWLEMRLILTLGGRAVLNMIEKATVGLAKYGCE
jgi:hypothetical protein